VPLLLAKFERNLRSRLPAAAAERVLECCAEQDRLERMPVQDFAALFVA
jgi:2-methylcitrate dehydratase